MKIIIKNKIKNAKFLIIFKIRILNYVFYFNSKILYYFINLYKFYF